MCRLQWFVIVVMAAAMSTPTELLVRACAPAPPPNAWVTIRQEEAVIFWDPESQTEHFIRRAVFNGQTKDFGFLVPTPSEPELGEANEDLFSALAAVTSPPVKYVERKVPGPPPMSDGMVRSAPRVEVLQQQQVAGFDAAVLKANDPDALAKWLEDHGYAYRPALRDWLKEYTQKEWIITAFKMSSSNDLGELRSKAVRMSFKTERPFYPYREPEDMRDPERAAGNRSLRVYFVGTERMEGRLGENRWQARTLWSNSVDSSTLHSSVRYAGLAEKLQRDSWWVTEFLDEASPRPGTEEVYFAPASDQSTVARPPIVREVLVYDTPTMLQTPAEIRPGIPLWLLAGGGVVVVLLAAVCGIIIARR